MNGQDVAATVLSEQFDMEFLQDDDVGEQHLRGEDLQSKGLCFVHPVFQPTLDRWRGEAVDDGGGLLQCHDLPPGVRVTLEELEAWGDPWVVAPALRALAERAKEWHGAECKVGVFIDCPQRSGASEEEKEVDGAKPPQPEQPPPQSPQLAQTKPLRTQPEPLFSETYVI